MINAFRVMHFFNEIILLRLKMKRNLKSLVGLDLLMMRQSKSILHLIIIN